jgi:hypothetical protein
MREELEKFFVATDELEDKKLDIIGWKGPKTARQAIQDAAKSAAKTVSRFTRPSWASLATMIVPGRPLRRS